MQQAKLADEAPVGKGHDFGLRLEGPALLQYPGVRQRQLADRFDHPDQVLVLRGGEEVGQFEPADGQEDPARLIAERGRLGWQKASGYNRRALAEVAISRYKRVIGDALRSRTNSHQATEVTIAVHALNRMLELGRPESVRIA